MTTRKRPQYPYAKKVKTIHLENAEKESKPKKEMFGKASYMIFGALGAAALFGGAQIPFVRKVAFPVLATFVTKNLGLLKGKLPMLQMA
jgi:hypothetical protein